jgi:hypothetical protein
LKRVLFAALALTVATGLLADVVLHPGTLTGTVGISGWTPSSTTVDVTNGTFSAHAAPAADGTFSMTLEGDQTYLDEYVTLYFGNGVYSNYDPAQAITVPLGGTVPVDLHQPGATLTAQLSAVGGTVTGWTPRISGNGPNFGTWSDSNVSAFSVPVVAGIPYTVAGSAKVDVTDATGAVTCSVQLPFGPLQQPALAEGATNTVSLSFSVDASNCATGIAGTVALTGLPAGYETSYGSLRAISDATQTSASWARENPHDYRFNLAPGDYYLPGYTYIDGPWSTYLVFPFRGTVQVTSGATSRHDLILSAVLATGNLSFTGPAGMPTTVTQRLVGVYDFSQQDYGPTAQASADIAADPNGHFAGIVFPGRWTAQILGSFSNAFGEPGGQTFTVVDSTQPELLATDGLPLSLPDQSFAFSTGTIVFDVVETPGEPEVGISSPTVTAWFSDDIRSFTLNGSSPVSNAATPSVRLTGPAGHYQFQAYATVRGSSTQFASSTIDLGQAVDTPAGSGVIVVPKDSNGNPTPIQLEFNTVTAGGSTTASVTDVGPAAPFDYDLLTIIAGKPYVDVSTSAQFAGKVEIAAKYDPAALGISPENEPRLALQQYVCNQADSCGWVVINEVYNPHVPPYTDADARYFGRSGQSNPDTTNHIIYGVTTSLGTFALTFPKVVMVPPTDTCVGTATGPAQLTTDPALCSATVDNLNQRAGGCSGGGGGLASCLFDGLVARTLGLGPHAVSIVGTSVDGATASCTSYVDVADREKPAIACAAPATVECTGSRTVYTASATCIDNCGTCTASCGSGPFALGTTTIDCNANDDASNRNTCQTQVTVRDTTPPSLTMSFNPPKCWSQNRQLISIPVTVTAADVCDAAPTIECQAWSVDSHGTRQDYEVVWVDGQLSIVRPSHQRTGRDRTYTLECSATDTSGNRASSRISLTVQNDEGDEDGDFDWDHEH